MNAQNDEKQAEQTESGDDVRALPSSILVGIHGLGNATKHEQLRQAAQELGIDMIITSNETDKKSLSEQQRAKLYADLVMKHKPEMLIAQSSGGNVVSSLVVDLRVWSGATWIISARLIESIYKSKHKDLPLLFSHGTQDNLAYMQGVCKHKFSRCKLVEFDGDHYAMELFTNDHAIESIKETIKMCHALRLAEPKQLVNKLSLAEMMQQKFATK